MNTPHHMLQRTARLFGGLIIVLLGASSLLSCGASSAISSVAASVRTLTGSVSVGSLAAPSLNKSHSKTAVSSCSGVSVCCWGYTKDSPMVAALDSSCNFSIALPLGGYCYCGFFNGTDMAAPMCT